MVQGGRKVAEAVSRGVSDGDRTDTARRQSIGFVRVHRTRRMPAFSRTGPIRFASPPRAVADAAHGFTKLDEARAVVAEGVQRQACSIAQIGLELRGGVNRDSLHLRAALAEVRDGIRSVGPTPSTAGCSSTASSLITSRRPGSTTTGPRSMATSGPPSTKGGPSDGRLGMRNGPGGCRGR